MRKYGKGWHGESHRHYLASKGIMTSGADLMMKSNMLGRRLDLKDAFEKGESITPHAAHEGSEVLPRAVAAGESRELLPEAEMLGERYMTNSNESAKDYFSAKGYYARTIGPKHKAEVERLVDEAESKGIVQADQVVDYVHENMPEEAFDTWEGAHTEMQRVAMDKIMDPRREKKGYFSAKGVAVGYMASEDEYVVQGKYPGPYGWEEVTAEETRPEAVKRMREYQENEPGVPFRIRKVHMKNE